DAFRYPSDDAWIVRPDPLPEVAQRTDRDAAICKMPERRVDRHVGLQAAALTADAGMAAGHRRRVAEFAGVAAGAPESRAVDHDAAAEAHPDIDIDEIGEPARHRAEAPFGGHGALSVIGEKHVEPGRLLQKRPRHHAVPAGQAR